MEGRRATRDLAALLLVYSLLPSGLHGEVPGLGQAVQDAVGVPHSANLRLSSVGVLESAGGPAERKERWGPQREKGEGCTCAQEPASEREEGHPPAAEGTTR